MASHLSEKTHSLELDRDSVNLYQLLQVPTDADTRELQQRIQQFYLEAQQNLDHRNAKKRLHFQQMYEIYLPQARHILLHPERRADYDRFLRALESPTATPPVSLSTQGNIETQRVQHPDVSQHIAAPNDLSAQRMVLWQQWQDDLKAALAETEEKITASKAFNESELAVSAAPDAAQKTPTNASHAQPRRSWSVDSATAPAEKIAETRPSPIHQTGNTKQPLVIKVEHLAAAGGLAFMLLGFLFFQGRASKVGSASGVSQPFRGVPAAVPGIVQVEDYDQGGEGVAYSDTSTQDQGGGYRKGAVGIGSISPGQYYVGWTQSGEWVQHTIEVGKSGKYRLWVRIMTRTAGSFSVQVDGKDVASGVTVPDTGGFWQELPLKPFELSKGRHVVRLVLHDQSMNFDFLRFAEMV